FEGDSVVLHWQAESTPLADLEKVSIEPDIGDVAESGSLEFSNIRETARYTVRAHSKIWNVKSVRIHALKPYCEGYDQVTGSAYRVGLEVSMPDDDKPGPHPAVVIIHGGSFSGGDMIELAAYADEAVKRDYVAVNINYRLLPADEDATNYSWPAALQDVKCAIRYVRANAGSFNIDVNRIGVMGHSAGGYLATMLGLTGQADVAAFDDVGQYPGRDDSVAALVSIAAPLDLIDAYEHLRNTVILDPEFLLVESTLQASLDQIFETMGLYDDDEIDDADRTHPGYVASTPYTYIQNNAYGNLERPMMFIYGESDIAIRPWNGCNFVDRVRANAAAQQLEPQAIMRQYMGEEASHVAFVEAPVNGLVQSFTNYGRFLKQTLQESFDFFDVYLKGAPRDKLPVSNGCD
ncbi:MAG: alpha/beta hydrolase, partial [Ketobacteraceae bacterium]|nr:alpha/beta hydrolase [Ketobacteraceae bacterium]